MSNELYSYYLNCLGSIPTFLEKYFNVPSLVRLKNIGYFCGMDYASKDVYAFKEKISRFDHSLSVALLTWRFTQNKGATLAGLFHDVATPCFSHVIDYMNKDYENQESTEELTGELINDDQMLISLLKEDDLSPEDIIDFKQYPIVDNKRPRLCADRFDGIILTSIAWTKSISKEEIKLFLDDLEIYYNEEGIEELGFKTETVAQRVTELSKQIDEYCHSNEDNYMMELLALITRKSIENNLFTYQDLYYFDEKKIISIIKSSKIDDIMYLFHEFETIRLHEIPNTILEGVKIRDLNPLVQGKRLNLI